MTIKGWLQRLVAAYRPIYLRGVLLDGPCCLAVARVREPIPADPVTTPTPAHAELDTMPLSPSHPEICA
ncbi:MAG: hypothetical protein ABI389_06940 [Rhodanobacter sp.]